MFANFYGVNIHTISTFQQDVIELRVGKKYVSWLHHPADAVPLVPSSSPQPKGQILQPVHSENTHTAPAPVNKGF